MTPYGHSYFKHLGVCLNAVYHLNEKSVIETWQSYLWAIFNPENSQKVPKIAILAYMEQNESK